MKSRTPPYFTEKDVPRLLDGEDPDIRREAEEVAGVDWLVTPNIRLGGRTPEQAIQDNQEFWVRDILRSIKSGGFS
jgi:hypothetical protein